jgi:O-antigen/teichoic acid export membrane protein
VAETVQRARGFVVQAIATRHTPVYRSSYALMLTTVVNAALGLLFWVAAARLYPADVVGLGAGGISAMQLVAAVGWVGLIYTLMRYMPVAGRFRRRLLAGAYVAGVGTSLPIAVVLVVALARWFEVPYVGSSAINGFVFCAAVATWVVFTLQDAALIGLRRPGVVTVENLLYGLLKLVLLLSLSSLSDPWVILGVWAGSALVCVIAVNGFISRHPLMADPADPPAGPSKRTIARFSVGHTAAATINAIPDYLVPLLVLSYLDPAANAFYYAAWSVSLSVRTLSVNVTSALMVEASYGYEALGQLLRKAGRLFAFVLAPTMAFVLLAADQIMRLFGADYADEGSAVLRLFALSLVPFTIVTLALALDRLRERFADALLISAVATATTVGLDLVLIPAQGASGAALGWLCGQSAAAGVALFSLWRGLKRRRS